jgi:hypothetical protein
MVGWWGSSGGAQQLPLPPVPGRGSIKRSSPHTMKPGVDPALFLVVKKYVYVGNWGASESGSIVFQTWRLFAEGDLTWTRRAANNVQKGLACG